MPVESHKLTGAGASEESLLPELLYALSQPLTALRCSLELTLLQPRNSDEYRKRLRESLDLTKDIATLAHRNSRTARGRTTEFPRAASGLRQNLADHGS